MGAERGAPAAAMRRAAAVREMESRASLEPYRRKASGGGKRTVALRSCGDAARLAGLLGGRLELAAPSSLPWRLRAGVEAVAIFFASLTSRCVKGIASLRSCCVDFASLALIGSC